MAEDTGTPLKDDSPEARMARRYPQKIRVGDLKRYPLTEFDRRTIGDIKDVVRTPAGKIELVVLLSRRLGWTRRLTAVPIEVVAIRGVEVVALDVNLDMVRAMPTFVPGSASVLDDNDTTLIALTKS